MRKLIANSYNNNSGSHTLLSNLARTTCALNTLIKTKGMNRYCMKEQNKMRLLWATMSGACLSVRLCVFPIVTL